MTWRFDNNALELPGSISPVSTPNNTIKVHPDSSIGAVAVRGKHRDPLKRIYPSYQFIWGDEFEFNGTPARLPYDASQRWATYNFNTGTPAINNSATCSRLLKAGTYNVSILGFIGTNYAIVTLYLNGASKGSVDWYGTNAYNGVRTYTSVSVPSDDLYSIELRATSKNPSSTGYFHLITYALFTQYTTEL